LKTKLEGLQFPDVVEVQEGVTDELKRVLKEEISAAFQKLYHRARACVYANGTYLEKKKYVSSIFKKSARKLLGRTAYVYPVLFS